MSVATARGHEGMARVLTMDVTRVRPKTFKRLPWHRAAVETLRRMLVMQRDNELWCWILWLVACCADAERGELALGAVPMRFIPRWHKQISPESRLATKTPESAYMLPSSFYLHPAAKEQQQRHSRATRRMFCDKVHHAAGTPSASAYAPIDARDRAVEYGTRVSRPSLA
ncbi:hypothetical protein CC86DRAFT_418857 [Ophiobolus disseminans]|uniref:Uncharacterized protein n=1 Tax=Ophiobolus disseminans TaxID=1469910 RepID=A0A6A6ZW89_9PLEO|nr:hypothetical protein CC86DRAFT_418857 [Ophiobolus disseminans]